ncbi:MAG: hypothetical protein LBI90_00955 [Treponema sp.]|jgi:hypothetical protein|nr:hypothetical protein [Treponema sp.]
MTRKETVFEVLWHCPIKPIPYYIGFIAQSPDKLIETTMIVPIHVLPPDVPVENILTMAEVF